MKNIMNALGTGAILCCTFFLFTHSQVFAHEQYVLTKEQLEVGMADQSTHILSALNNPENIKIGLFVGIGITLSLGLYTLFQYSPLGQKIDNQIRRLEPVGHVFLRVALAAFLFASAYYHSFMGPEIPVSSLPLGQLLIPIMYILSVLLLFGVFTRVVGIVCLLILLAATVVYGEYIITYLNYYGEFIALILFGSYVFSIDKSFLGTAALSKKARDIELLIIRVTYGISVMYPAITLKLMHPKVIVDIVHQYHLNDIHWLFPSDPLLIALGTAMAQILVGCMIIAGFGTRFASIATFFLYLLSVLYFKEAVWPHYILLALAFYLAINNGGNLTLDTWLGKIIQKRWKKKKKSVRK